MLNILVDVLPSSVEIDGQEYKIDTDYRSSLITILAFEDKELTQYEKVELMLDNLYFVIPFVVPPYTEEAIIQAYWFLNAGKSNEDEDLSRRLYSFSKDGGFIYSAFQQTHSIDLQDTDLHWWKFMALFMDTGQDTTFSNLVGLRSRYYANKCTKEEKEYIRKLGDVFIVEDDEQFTPEEQEIVDHILAIEEKDKQNRNAK